MDMEYEFLLRGIYDCGRDYQSGADAYIYRQMEHAELLINDSNWGKPKSEKEYDYRVKFSKVRNYVEKAIVAGMKKFHCNNQEQAEINSMLSELTPFFYDKHRLDEIITKVTDIFSSHGLKVY